MATHFCALVLFKCACDMDHESAKNTSCHISIIKSALLVGQHVMSFAVQIPLKISTFSYYC